MARRLLLSILGAAALFTTSVTMTVIAADSPSDTPVVPIAWGSSLVDPAHILATPAPGSKIVIHHSGYGQHGSSSCTLAASGRDASRRHYALTAGHCGSAGDVVETMQGVKRYRLGRIALSVVRRDHVDYALIAMDSPAPLIGNPHEIAAPRQGQALISRGATTPIMHGVDDGVRGDFDHSDASEHLSSLDAHPGDSGAPVTSTDGTTLYGIVQGIHWYGDKNDLRTTFGVYTPMTDIMADIERHGSIGMGLVLD